MRLLLAPLAAVLSLPLLGVAPAAASGGHVHVTAVVRDAHGHLTFRRGAAADPAAGRQLAGRWRGEANVVVADVDHRIRAAGTPDPLAAKQWALTTLHAADVGVATGQVVAVVDTGVDAAHADLSGVVLPGTDIVAGAGDGRTDPNGHGTHVAGIVAAVADNGIGGAGLAQGARVLPVRVMAADGTGWDSDAAKGMVWAVDHGATVINLSFGGPDPSPVLATAVRYALSHDVAVVVAAGNEGSTGDPVEYPAADPGVIAVTAVDAAGVRPAWSSTGNHVALAAPGVAITSTTPGNAYATWDGTSMAAPFVSAAVALLRHAQPTLNAAAVRQRLMSTADDLGPPGFDPFYGAGRVNVLAAEGRTPTTVASSPAPPAATPSASPSAAPSAASSAAPTPPPTAAPTSAPTAVPTAVPAPPAVAVPLQMTARVSASRTTAPYAGAVTVTTRVLADGEGLPGLAVRLERQVGGSWVETRVGTTGDGGLAFWVLHPDRTTTYRFTGNGWSSPLLRIAITPVPSLRAGRTGLTGRVLPAGATAVRVDVRRGTGWVALTTVTSASDGTFRLSRGFAVGTVLRAVAAGNASPTARVS